MESLRKDRQCGEGKVFFVSGIDTGIGKSYAAGYMARLWNERGIRTITQKLVQTGNTGFSEDIERHRRIMGSGLWKEDRQGLTMPEVYSYPCSPHLAAEIDRRPMDFEKVQAATLQLAACYDRVLLEGAGGLMVPLTRKEYTIDYVVRQGYPVILVTSGRLGSINHTVLSLEAMQRRGIPLHTLVYNRFDDARDRKIAADTYGFIRDYVKRNHPSAGWLDLPVIEEYSPRASGSQDVV